MVNFIVKVTTPQLFAVKFVILETDVIVLLSFKQQNSFHLFRKWAIFHDFKIKEF